jgi:hypothetical protein
MNPVLNDLATIAEATLLFVKSRLQLINGARL